MHSFGAFLRIGYSGSTGDFTGDYLQFEVNINGILENPLYKVLPQKGRALYYKGTAFFMNLLPVLVNRGAEIAVIDIGNAVHLFRGKRRKFRSHHIGQHLLLFAGSGNHGADSIVH